MPVQKPKLETQAATANPVVSPPKVDYATELFNLLSLEDSGENDSRTCAVNNPWAGMQSVFFGCNIRAIVAWSMYFFLNKSFFTS